MNDKTIITGVFGIAVNTEQKFLLTQRNSPNHPIAHMKWQFPGGGLEFGELPEETLVREFQEEAGCTPTVLFSHPYVSASTWLKKSDTDPEDHQVIVITYLVDIGDQNVDVSKDDETHTFGWFTFDEAMELDCLPNVKDCLKSFQKIITVTAQKEIYGSPQSSHD